MSLTSVAPIVLPPCSEVVAVAAEDAMRWLTRLYGHEVAVEAMKLPPELRATLYPELFTYGPAAEQVSHFLSAFSRWKPTHYPIRDALKEVSLNAISFNGMSSYFLFRRLGNEKGLHLLLTNLEDATEKYLVGDEQIDSGIYITIFMLTSQVALTHEEAAQFRYMVRKVNRVLRICGMERLSGSFEKRYFWRGRR